MVFSRTVSLLFITALLGVTMGCSPPRNVPDKMSVAQRISQLGPSEAAFRGTVKAIAENSDFPKHLGRLYDAVFDVHCVHHKGGHDLEEGGKFTLKRLGYFYGGCFTHHVEIGKEYFVLVDERGYPSVRNYQSGVEEVNDANEKAVVEAKHPCL